MLYYFTINIETVKGIFFSISKWLNMKCVYMCTYIFIKTSHNKLK